jgi:hypothetical protein
LQLRHSADAGPPAILKIVRHLSCPCGELITGSDDDELVELTQAHLKQAHPDHEYTRDEILFLAY